MSRLTVKLMGIISSLEIYAWRMRFTTRRLRVASQFRIMASFWTNIRPHSRLKSTTDRVVKAHPGVACTALVVGVGIAVVTLAAKRDGTNNGARRCDRRWISFAMKTERTLN